MRVLGFKRLFDKAFFNEYSRKKEKNFIDYTIFDKSLY